MPTTRMAMLNPTTRTVVGFIWHDEGTQLPPGFEYIEAPEGGPITLGQVDPVVQDKLKAARISKADLLTLKGFFNHENRLRILEGKAEITEEQFRTALKALLPDL